MSETKEKECRAPPRQFSVEESRLGGQQKSLRKTMSNRIKNLKHGRYADSGTLEFAQELMAEKAFVREALRKEIQKLAKKQDSNSEMSLAVFEKFLKYDALVSGTYTLCFGNKLAIERNCDDCPYNKSDEQIQILTAWRKRLATVERD